MLLEAWRDFEREDGDEKSQAEVQLFTFSQVLFLFVVLCLLGGVISLYICHAGPSAASQEGEEETEGSGRGWKRPGMGRVL